MLYITLRQLEYAVAIARAGSLSRAAEKLNISQPSLSVALTQIEKRLGQRLFLRGKGMPLALTPFAERYLADAETLLAMARRLDDPAMAGHVSGRSITLGCFEDLAPRYLAPVLGHLGSSLPDIEIRWRIADFETLAREMVEGRIDLSLTYDLGLDASLDRYDLGPAVPHAFVSAGHRLAGREGVSLDDLADEALILFEEGLSIRHVLGLFRQIGRTASVAHRVGSLEVMRSLAASGLGVGISYTVPPGNLAYDGAAVVAIPVTDAIARENMILAGAGSAAADDALAAVHRQIVAHWARHYH